MQLVDADMYSGQSIATSHELGPQKVYSFLEGKSSIPGKSRLVKYFYIIHGTFCRGKIEVVNDSLFTSDILFLLRWLVSDIGFVLKVTIGSNLDAFFHDFSDHPPVFKESLGH